MDDLAERIKASIEDPNSELWFPDLTADLVARAWDILQRDTGLTSNRYGTERALSRSISAPRDIVAHLQTCPSACTAAPTISIEALTPESAIKYLEQGVMFYSAEETLPSTILLCLEDALAIINQVPSLMRTVASLVRSLHVIKPEDSDHDVSFSEPHVPFSIFVSVPEERIANDALRVAEAIVHEAMHLQLTLIEKVISLVGSTTSKYYSPWKKDYRDSRGVLHAVYVFSVVDQFLAVWNPMVTSESDLGKYTKGRRHQIRKQMADLQSFRVCSDLTTAGAFLAQTLLNLMENPGKVCEPRM